MKVFFGQRCFGALVAGCLAFGALSVGAEVPSGAVNTGQDFTQPLSRIDLRARYQRGVGDENSNTAFTARADIPRDFGDGWQLALRFDVPYLWSSQPSSENPEGDLEHGLSDVLVQGLMIAPAGGKWSYGVGAQLIFPTARKEAMGTGKLQLVPTLGVKYDLGDWARGAWCAILARHAFDVASRDSDRPHISQTYLQPIFNIMLPRLWFLTFAPEARYDWRARKWFVPFDLTVGKMITEKLVVSIEYKNAIVDDLPLFSHEVEARIGFLF